MADEGKLIKSCKEGDLYSFEILVSNYEKAVYNIAYRMVQNEEDAFDLSQEIFLKVYKAIHKFDEKSKFSTWIYRVATNTCLDFLRKSKKRQNIVSLDANIGSDDKDDLFMQIEDKDANTHDIVERKFKNQELIEALNKLSPEHRIVIVLKDIQGLSHEEIAKALKLNVGTVKSRISRARENLKKILIDSELI